ncbi:MAG: hypothetical protein WCB27_05045, partial [Thermoguttaceae bacterium]
AHHALYGWRFIDGCEYVVFSLISYLLTVACAKSTAGRFKKTIRRAEEHIEQVRREMVEESWPALDAQKMIHASEKAIVDLPKEVQACKEAYDAFCRDVVGVLCSRVEFIEDLEKL